jgi:chromosome partitioning protein
MSATLPSEWTQEAYVSLHLVQAMLECAGLPARSASSHWLPEFRVKVPSIRRGKVIDIDKKVDFFIKDYSRQINFLIEVKTTETQIDSDARIQLEKYLRHSNVRFGLLIDPYLIEIYEFHEWNMILQDRFAISDPANVKPAAQFLKKFLDRIKMRTIAIHTSKGGVGKTTLTVNIAYELARRGNRVLVIDLDDQANASLSLGVNRADELDQAQSLEDFENILDSFKNRPELIEFLTDYELPAFNVEKYIKPTLLSQTISKSGCPGKLDVLPSSYKTNDSAIASLGTFPQKRLDKALRNSGLANSYDYVIIDTPPSSTTISVNGLFAAQYVLIPSQLEYLSVHGIRTPIKRLREIQEESSRRGIILGIVPMMTKEVKLSSTIKGLISKNFPGITLLPEISNSTYVGQASHSRQPVSLYAQDVKGASKSAKQFSSLADEIVKKIDTLESAIGV